MFIAAWFTIMGHLESQARCWHLLGVKDCATYDVCHLQPSSTRGEYTSIIILKPKKIFTGFPKSPGALPLPLRSLMGSHGESVEARVRTCLSPTQANGLSVLSLHPSHWTLRVERKHSRSPMLKHGPDCIPQTWIPPPTGERGSSLIECHRMSTAHSRT